MGDILLDLVCFRALGSSPRTFPWKRGGSCSHPSLGPPPRASPLSFCPEEGVELYPARRNAGHLAHVAMCPRTVFSVEAAETQRAAVGCAAVPIRAVVHVAGDQRTSVWPLRIGKCSYFKISDFYNFQAQIPLNELSDYFPLEFCF